jgi:hypothetical protein
MASNTQTLQNTISWAQYFVGNRPLAVSTSPNGMEPALTSANTIIQTILQPPFRWRWNRSSVTFLLIDPAGWVQNTTVALGYRIKDSNGNMQTVTTAGTTVTGSHPTWATTAGGTTNDNGVVWTCSLGATDYTISIPTFGYIEKASISLVGSIGASSVHEIPNIKQELTTDAASGRAHTIGPILDDNSGNITFRFLPGLPDQKYSVTVYFQKQAVLLSGLTGTGGTWPIPDRFGFIVNNGFLGMIYLFSNDARAPFMLQKFAGNLLALADGLTEQERNTFLEQWDMLLVSERSGAKGTQGMGGRQL